MIEMGAWRATADDPTMSVARETLAAAFAYARADSASAESSSTTLCEHHRSYAQAVGRSSYMARRSFVAGMVLVHTLAREVVKGSHGGRAIARC